LLAIIILILVIPRLGGFYALFWSADLFKSIFYEDLGFSEAWSSTIAVFISFGYAIAFLYLLGWGILRVLARRANPRQIAGAFLAYAIVYALPPAIHAAGESFADPVCFNQKDGKPIKWFVVQAGGEIVLSGSDGFDRFGNKKQPVTKEICEIFDQQRLGLRPHPATADPRDIEFFDSVTGQPKIWFSEASDGTLALYDAPGFDPTSRQLLKPMAPELVTRLLLGAEERSPRTPASPSATKGCPGKVMPELVLGADWTPINDGTCNVVYEIVSGEVAFETKQGTRMASADDVVATEFWLGDILRAKASFGSARIRYSLCPPATARHKVGFDCRE
jgi:hypothetical protein